MQVATDKQRAYERACKERIEIVAFDSAIHGEQVIALAREMHAESIPYRGTKLNEEKLLKQLEAAHTLDHVYFRVCVKGERVLGGFFGIVSTLYFSDELCAKDLAWFVTKNRRGSLAAVMLLADFELWGKRKGIKLFMVGQSTGVRMATTTALYEHMGYQVTGCNTFKRV